MSLVGDHLRGLATFSGRENRQPFWLWVLIVYVALMAVMMVVMVPLMTAWMAQSAPLMSGDPEALQRNPGAMFALMAPMMRDMMLVNVGVSCLHVLLLGAAAVRRLHDRDSSGFWIVPLFAWQIGSQIFAASAMPAMMRAMAAIDPQHPEQAGARMAGAMGGFMTVQSLGLLVLVITVVVLALPGTAGPNQFGDDPLARPR